MSKERLEEHTHVGISMSEYQEYEDLKKRVQELEELIAAYHTELSIKDNANKRIKKKNKRYREALEKIKLNVKICGNEEYFPKVVEEIVNEALEGEE